MARRLIGTALVLSLATLLVACDDGSPLAPSPVYSAPPPVTTVDNPPALADFVGQVLSPVQGGSRSQASRPLSGVTVTILSGPRSGEWVDTDHDGRYTFPNLEGDEFRIRLEKAGYETKEAIVHRTMATTLTDGVPLEHGGPQDMPGVILIGVAWPGYAKAILQEMTVVADLLLVKDPASGGSHGHGLVVVNDPDAPPENSPLAHEMCHAHQHGMVRPRGGGVGSGTAWHSSWVDSAEGRAYVKARNNDRRVMGHNPMVVRQEQEADPWADSPVVLIEESAEFCARWWGAGYLRYDVAYWRHWLEESAPHRTEWLGEWLSSR